MTLISDFVVCKPQTERFQDDYSNVKSSKLNFKICEIALQIVNVSEKVLRSLLLETLPVK